MDCANIALATPAIVVNLFLGAVLGGCVVGLVWMIVHDIQDWRRSR